MSRNPFVDTSSSSSSPEEDISSGSNSTNDPAWLPAKAQSNSSGTIVESSSSQPNFNLSLPVGFEKELSIPEEFEEDLIIPEGFGEGLFLPEGFDKDMNVVEVSDVFQEPDLPEVEENGNNRLDARNVNFEDAGDYIEAAQPNQTKKATAYAVKTYNDVILQYSSLKKVPYLSLEETPVEQLSKRLSTFFMLAKKSNGEVVFVFVFAI